MANQAFRLIVACAVCTAARAVFNFTTCPSPEEIWALGSDPEKVPRDFDLSKFAPSTPGGALYYELAFHDWTQKPACPDPKCVTSRKVYDPALNQVNDTFSLECFGGVYYPELRFKPSETKGSLKAWWENPLHLSKQAGWIPDVVVDFQLNQDGSGYDWVLELQCVEEAGHVWFVGINFYSRQQSPGDEYVQNFLQVGRDFGLGPYMDSGLKVTVVDHSNCSAA